VLIGELKEESDGPQREIDIGSISMGELNKRGKINLLREEVCQFGEMLFELGIVAVVKVLL
jgi:hypothetical protein